MSSELGNILKISLFGQSHGSAVGVVMDGLPAGEPVDTEALGRLLDRRRPGLDYLSSPRSEGDEPVFLSGLENGRTVGAPLCAVIYNQDARPSDYALLADTPRPGHADYTAWVKWGEYADTRGGGHLSGRLTAPLCVAGGIAMQLLSRRGIYVGAHLRSVAGIEDRPFPPFPDRELLEAAAAKPFPVLDEEAGARMRAAILSAKAAGDSVGGVIECAAIGVPAGLGAPIFGGVENRLAAALFGIPAVKGVEFGLGFESARVTGSVNNDPFTLDGEGRVILGSNNCGGILGGISCGAPILFRAAVKPTPSIARRQSTVSLSEGREKEVEIGGRHDPCVAHRAVPVVEAVTAAVILDMLLEEAPW